MTNATVPLWDGLTFFGPSLFGRDVSEQQLLANLDGAGVAGCVAAAHKPPTYHLPSANDAVLELAQAHPDRVIALSRVDPWQGQQAVAEVTRTHTQGAAGILLHPWEECFAISDEVVNSVVESAGQLGMPVVVTGGFPWLSEALQVADLALRHPDVQFVVTNGAQLNMSGLAGVDVDRALESCPNLVLHASGLYRQDFLDSAIATIGPERVAFGSSSPYYNLRLEAERMRRTSYPDEQAAAAVCNGNTLRWFVGGAGVR